MKPAVTGFVVDDFNCTNPNNTGSAKNTQIILFKVLGPLFICFFHPHILMGTTPYILTPLR